MSCGQTHQPFVPWMFLKMTNTKTFLLSFRLDNLRLFSFTMIKAREALSFHFKAKFVQIIIGLPVYDPWPQCVLRTGLLPSHSSTCCHQCLTAIFGRVKENPASPPPCHAKCLQTAAVSDISVRSTAWGLDHMLSYGTLCASECICS